MRYPVWAALFMMLVPAVSLPMSIMGQAGEKASVRQPARAERVVRANRNSFAHRVHVTTSTSFRSTHISHSVRR